ncbi:MAG: hypothetical protein GX458_11015 [Phyllobacteriaceae bacterium]|nr:hypothetical protein [Phyllobacteriaceae bacterium]
MNSSALDPTRCAASFGRLVEKNRSPAGVILESDVPRRRRLARLRQEAVVDAWNCASSVPARFQKTISSEMGGSCG